MARRKKADTEVAHSPCPFCGSSVFKETKKAKAGTIHRCDGCDRWSMNDER